MDSLAANLSRFRVFGRFSSSHRRIGSYSGSSSFNSRMASPITPFACGVGETGTQTWPFFVLEIQQIFAQAKVTAAESGSTIVDY
jgi:hypothetical protein